ncbi:glycine betaine ABC transporter substrate-binding protein [Aquibacillus sp. 3ASR75-11]|uniref:Glycine betaine ABC transporter substrate-binding protein n=1 Tax=Terrihalobacillus insolitus TaxID=2950438 RepID=A0A9X3WQ46_9BACI|nr:glycine betaine ABC transporter substrate-binding protein [Terrihalobacillus insolitus]MDC3412157.1 glycine betaine ABC transporter substrate-binding protein [Terrihalobacillus insolitus]MDC3423150.1 glycine betaine ABC transporter substrate-binding protein [Terrihalobacillus insolitus]
MKKIISLFTIIILITVLTACSGSGSADKKITVGAKSFTEQFLLAKMTALMLEDNGFEVDEKSNMGSSALRKALENKQVDLTWDYTGTGLVTYLGQDPIAEKQKAYETLKQIDEEENGIVWTNLADANNTYTIMMRKEQSEELGITSISDLADYMNNSGDFRFATDAEFANRPDGLPGVEETYQFEFPDENVKEMSIGLYYDALKNEEVETAVGFATDARIQAFDLVNLEDDKSFFPSYNAAIAMTDETYEKYPEIEEIFKPLSDMLDGETLMDLNYQVDIEEKSVDEVAENFLVENGLLDE